VVVSRKVLTVDPDSDIGRFLERMPDQPVIVETGRERFRIVREREDVLTNYDPERARAAVEQMYGVLKGQDLQSLKEELREMRDQDSIGRPA
jgi:hypothetical protein